jgi:predicted esterase
LENGKLMKKTERLFFLFIALLFVAGGCGENTKKKRIAGNGGINYLPLQKDTLYNDVKTVKDTAYSYSVYIPGVSGDNGALPVVFFFDAHARGSLPVKKYRSLARKYGFILAGSNNSKNGMSNTERNKIIYNFMEDVERRTPFDPARIYVSGFSGGARIASGIALNNKGIAGTIACAAGFPQENVKPGANFTFIGIVGNSDFNYLEMKSVKSRLDALNVTNSLLVFDGNHDWPPEKTMNKAFTLLQLNAMQRGSAAKNANLVSDFYKNEKREIDSLLKNKKLLQAHSLCKETETFLKGLYDLKNCKTVLSETENNPLLKKEIYNEQLLFNKEQKNQQRLLRALYVKDSIWWKNELSSLKKGVVKSKNAEERLMYKRLLNYLGLVSYIYAKRAAGDHDYGELAKYLLIYGISNPDNPEVYFMKAEYYATRGYPAKVIPTLKIAVEKGFDEPWRLEKNKSFHPFFDKKEFKLLVKKLKEKRKTL